MVIEKMYVIYFMHIDFIQSFSSNHWIKLNFESQNVVIHILKFFFLIMFGVFKKCHQDFSLLHIYYHYYQSGVKFTSLNNYGTLKVK
jgi:hypothetical protein